MTLEEAYEVEYECSLEQDWPNRIEDIYECQYADSSEKHTLTGETNMGSKLAASLIIGLTLAMAYGVLPLLQQLGAR